ncbi:MAG: YIP1 family protein [Roseovarius sp.]|nr:YIP1 family protein [Roseovarius sp.]
MNGSDFWALVRQSLFEPRSAASRLLAMRLPVEAGWLGLALMSVLNTLVYVLSILMSPPADPMAMGMVGPAFHMPALFAMVLFGALAITVVALTHVGRWLGGQGALGDVLVLLTWMQVLRLLVQVAVGVLALVAPALGALVVMVAGLWGLVILLVFVDAAHGFGSLFRAAGTVVGAVVALAVVLSVIFSLLGVPMMGGI